MSLFSRLTGASDDEWWRGAVIYQIYPRSFMDSNGDGIGDLEGITSKLDHVASLGVDAVWISPFFTSPMKDFGYDVSDYRDVDPMFGTLEDFDRLIAAAHDRDLRVMIDLVLSHSSDQHPWFQESRSSRDNPKSDWYVWADAKPDGTPPNNWLSIFGGSAWEWDTSRRQYYMHNFLTSQPDFNFHEPDVQKELLAIARFWLERGVDGFRLDTVNFYVHSQSLKDNPAIPEDERDDTTAPDVNPYNWQDHLYDKSQPENLEFLKKLRTLMNEFGAAAVGEVGDAGRSIDTMAEYTRGLDRLQMCYSFDFLSKAKPTPERVRSVLDRFFDKATDGWPCWAFSNHDVMRHPSRWSDGEADRDAYVKLLAGILMSLRGSVCIYQGEELGLTEADLAYEDLQDPYGIRFWPKFKGRDGCRTPMPWEGRGPHAGFSTGQPWLPVGGAHSERAVDQQQGEGSVLAQYRRFLAFRAGHPALARGDLEWVGEGVRVLAFVRSLGNERVFCAFNLSDEPAAAPAVDGEWAPLTGHGFDYETIGDAVELPRYGAYFARAT